MRIKKKLEWMLTKEDFIKQSIEIHSNKYIYDKSILKRMVDKVEIICPIHGSFYQSPKVHLKGHGCPKCAKEANVKRRTFTIYSFINKAKETHGNKYDYSKVEYTNNHTNVCIICPKHGEFWQRPANHLCGQGCPHCADIGRKDIKLLYYTNIDLNDKHICNYKCFRNKEKLLEELNRIDEIIGI